MRPRTLRIAIVSAFLLLGGCRAEEDVRVLRLAHSLDVSHPVHQGMAYMADRLAELSDGSMRVQIFPNGQLGGERETAELLQLGSIDITKVASSVIENFIPGMSVYSLPYLFDDSDHYWSVFQSDLGRSILHEGERYWMRGLCYYDAGFRSFIIQGRRVEAPDDLRGLKIRVMPSNIQIQTINALGGHATPMAIGELYTAIQSGVVDGADGNPPTLYQTKLFEVSDYYILDEHSAPPDVMLMSTHTWNGLSDQQRAWLEQAVAESVERQRELWDASSDLALEAMREAGLEVVYPDKEPFRSAVQSMYERLEGTEMGALAQEIRSMNGGGVEGGNEGDGGDADAGVPAASPERNRTATSERDRAAISERERAASSEREVAPSFERDMASSIAFKQAASVADGTAGGPTP